MPITLFVLLSAASAAVKPTRGRAGPDAQTNAPAGPGESQPERRKDDSNRQVGLTMAIGPSAYRMNVDP